MFNNEKEFKLALKNVNFDLVTSKLSPCNMEWKFNPPITSPRMRGVWESLIKQVKQSLKSVTNHQVFTEQTVVIILCQIESIFNQQTLTAISDDCKDLKSLHQAISLLGLTYQICHLEYSAILKYTVRNDGKMFKQL